MPMSPESQRAALASQGDIVILQTLEISGPGIDTIRLVNDHQDLLKNDTTYQRFALKIKPPARDSDSVPKVEITVGIADQRVMQAMLELRGQRDVHITYAELEADNPDNELFRARFEYDKLTTDGATQANITATFMRGALNESYPAGRITPSNAGDPHDEDDE